MPCLPVGVIPWGTVRALCNLRVQPQHPQLSSLGLASRGPPPSLLCPVLGTPGGRRPDRLVASSPGGQVQRVGGSAESREGLVSVRECP